MKKTRRLYWAEFLIPEGAETLASYDHPFFGKWSAVTRNRYGAGALTYEGTFLSDTLQRKVVVNVLKSIHLTGPDQELPASLRAKHGVNRFGKKIHYYLNYSNDPQDFRYSYGEGTELLTGTTASNSTVHVKAWDLVVIEER